MGQIIYSHFTLPKKVFGIEYILWNPVFLKNQISYSVSSFLHDDTGLSPGQLKMMGKLDNIVKRLQVLIKHTATLVNTYPCVPDRTGQAYVPLRLKLCSAEEKFEHN